MIVHVDDGQAAGAAILEAARALQPNIRARADEIEEQRQLPPDLVEEMRAAGLFELLVPGNSVDPVTAARVVEEASVADGSAGWCVMIAAQNNALGGFMPDSEVRAVWGDRRIVAGVARPIGRAVATSEPEDGYVVSGRWPFASGSSHADFFCAECMVYDGDEPRLDAEGNGVSRMLYVPRSEVTLHDTWHTTGLRGTASNDFSVEGAFVPAARGFQMLVTPPASDSPMYRAAPLIFMNHGAQSLGVGRAAIEAAGELAKAKEGWGGVKLAEVPRIAATIAEATADIEAARAYMYGAAEALWESVQGESDDDALAPARARLRLATSNATAASVRAVDAVHRALATSSIFRSSALERPFRDIHTAAAHVMIGPMTYEAAGRVLLGAEPEFPFF